MTTSLLERLPGRKTIENEIARIGENETFHLGAPGMNRFFARD